ncbi:5'-methylthioadenosine/S-adenosylhomocysteine nucleosidase [Micromonospora sp. HNM0581]|uniref:5'-methylthioadenosine/S-adenosylhomocysteine nucleosidase family protein n=1 Tax=Micromonospora sp. HNM0581 TaxID=2716341 RepID=UPI00146E8E48|nr:hypothetical protein [Micromonospora sp. HNM0581]NLU79225.1 5'-methylthioadenosine/S-adenosylhomocysteine nucleosidase [Micromonospora sp. HNM0581]
MGNNDSGANYGIRAGGNIGNISKIRHSFTSGGQENAHRDAPTSGESRDRSGGSGQQTPPVDIAVLTVLSPEMQAMIEVFQRAADHRRPAPSDERRIHQATFTTPHGRLSAVLMQTMDRNQRSAATAYAFLRQVYRPRIVALVGIAGGINERVDVGDVVIADQVVYYDERREAADGTYRRGEATAVPARMSLSLSDLFSNRGEPFVLPSVQTRSFFTVVRGPIGSGGAVVTDQASDIRVYLQSFHEKCLAVETEAGGLVQAFREDLDASPDAVSWVVIRGVSDHADAAKGHRDHDLAARHAGVAFESLLPFLGHPSV